MKKFYHKKLSLKLLQSPGLAGILILEAIVLLSASSSYVYGDDLPKARCASVNSIVAEVRSNDTSRLSQIQLSNVRHYLDDLTRRGLKSPKIFYLLKDPVLSNRQFHFSLIFPDSNCESRCFGTAVLPGATAAKLQKFSYRRNVVIQPDNQNAGKAGQKAESISFIVLTENEQSLLAFHDLPSKPADGQETERSRSGQKILVPKSLERDSEKYLACLKNMFDVDAPMPGSGAR